MRLHSRISSSERSPQPSSSYGIGAGKTLLLFGGATLLLFVATHWVIPILARNTGVEPVLLWFAVPSIFVFAPLLVAAFLLLRREGALAIPYLWRRRLRFQPMELSDWLWSLGALAAIGALSAGSLAVSSAFVGNIDMQPSFMIMEPLTPGRYWILVVWLPFWVLNIVGEEILWRGVVLPRQEIAFGKWAWLANGMGWMLFHVAFGGEIFVALWPILFILPYVAQRRRNSWVGVIIHAGLNGPGFLAVAFGLA